MSGCIFLFIVVLLLIIILITPAIVCACRHNSHVLESILREPSGEPFSILSIALAFDTDHALVWETQIPLLWLIAKSGRHGILLRRLHRAYLESARHYPELYEGSSFKGWLEFLERAQLIAYTQKRALLTDQGRDFLHYRTPADDRFIAGTIAGLNKPTLLPDTSSSNAIK